jgi:hypothetical protein
VSLKAVRDRKPYSDLSLEVLVFKECSRYHDIVCVAKQCYNTKLVMIRSPEAYKRLRKFVIPSFISAPALKIVLKPPSL